MDVNLIYPAILTNLITILLFLNSHLHDRILLFIMIIGQLILISGESDKNLDKIQISHILFTLTIIIGSVYFYEYDGSINNWTLIQEIMPSNDNNESYLSHFGYSVDITTNTNELSNFEYSFAIVGAPDYSPNNNDLGAAYIYKRNDSGMDICFWNYLS